jgi:hypothetical protein
MSDTLEAPAVTASTETVAAAANAAAPLSVTAAALARCVDAYKTEYAAQLAKGKYDGECVRYAKIDYRRALPSPETLADIQAFIACVAKGISYEIYDAANPPSFCMRLRSPWVPTTGSRKRDDPHPPI